MKVPKPKWSRGAAARRSWLCSPHCTAHPAPGSLLGSRAGAGQEPQTHWQPVNTHHHGPGSPPLQGHGLVLPQHAAASAWDPTNTSTDSGLSEGLWEVDPESTAHHACLVMAALQCWAWRSRAPLHSLSHHAQTQQHATELRVQQRQTTSGPRAAGSPSHHPQCQPRSQGGLRLWGTSQGPS